MARKPAAQRTANWVKGMQSPQASQNYKDAMAALTVNPMELAAAQADKMLSGVQQAVTSGRWANKLRAVSLPTFKAACAAGASRLSSGAIKGQAKKAASDLRMDPIYDQMKAASISNGGTPGQKAQAAIDVLVAAKQNGQT